jgi:hypothetical protein
MHKTPVESILTHASETWVLSKASLFERRVLTSIVGAMQDKGTPRKRHNHEPDITNYIKVNRLSWAGHIIHTENSRKVKKVSDTRPERTRITGRPKLRWEDRVIQAIRESPRSEELEECGYE